MTAAVHAETVGAPCGRCGAAVGERCHNGDEPARIPHLPRLLAAGNQPAEQPVCSRCHQPADRLLLGICPTCAYRTEPPPEYAEE